MANDQLARELRKWELVRAGCSVVVGDISGTTTVGFGACATDVAGGERGTSEGHDRHDTADSATLTELS